MTNTWIDISLQEVLARVGGSHSLVLFTAPRGAEAAASQVHSFFAKMGCKSEQRKKGMEKCLFVGATIGKRWRPVLILQVSSPKSMRAHAAPEGLDARLEIQGACQ